MSKKHFNAISCQYDELRGIHPPLLERLVSEAKITNNSRVLDVGCGTGADLFWLREATRADVMGIDASEKMASIARARLGSHCAMRGNAEVLLTGFRAEFDVVLFKLSLQHFPDPGQVLNPAVSVLKDGGRLAVVTARSNDLKSFPIHGYFPELDRSMAEVADSLHQVLVNTPFRRLRRWQQVEVELMHERCDESLLERVKQRYLSPLRLLSDEELRIGISRIERDLESDQLNGIRSVRGTIYLTQKESA